jgi:uncharacterized protein (TIGR03067 family)
MKTPHFTAVVGICALLLVILGCSESKTVSPAKPNVQGRWSGVEDGKTEPITLTFTNNRFAYFDSRNNEIGSGTFSINDLVLPTQMDLTFESIPAPNLAGKIGHAVFELNGDELRIAGCEPGSDQRPTNTVSGPGVRAFLFKRE